MFKSQITRKNSLFKCVTSCYLTTVNNYQNILFVLDKCDLFFWAHRHGNPEHHHVFDCTTKLKFLDDSRAGSRDSAIYQGLYMLHASVPGGVMQLVLVQSGVLRSGTTVESPLPRSDSRTSCGVNLLLDSTQWHQVMELDPLPLELGPGHDANTPWVKTKQNPVLDSLWCKTRQEKSITQDSVKDKLCM